MVTFQIENDPDTGLPWLRFNKHRGSEDPAAEGISDLQITTLVPGSQYRIALTARSEGVDPIAGQVLTRTLTSDVRLRN